MWVPAAAPLLMSAPLGAATRVLGCGVAGVDFVAAVKAYPEADAKIRSERLDILGGGNVANTLTCTSRLGIPSALLTKLGDDDNGRLILAGLRDEGIDTRAVLTSRATPSPFTYIIVDRGAGTRTCIHTPMTEELTPAEADAAVDAEGVLDGVALLHCDGRMTAAAVTLAQRARARGVPVVLDAEKDRPHFGALLPLADFVVCNSAFPLTYIGATTREEGLRRVLDDACPHARFAVCTLGAAGSVLAYREEPWAGFGACEAFAQPEITRETLDDGGGGGGGSSGGGGGGVKLVRCGAFAADAVVDTTGAGDAFIGAVIYGILHRLSAERMLALASFVAARKLSAAGARAGLPTLAEVRAAAPELL